MSSTKFKVAPPPEQDDGSDSDDDLGVEVYELSANLDAEEPALPSFQRERCMPEPWMEYSAPKEREAFRARQRVAMGQASTVRPEREPPKGVNLARVFPNYGHAEKARAEYRAERESRGARSRAGGCSRSPKRKLIARRSKLRSDSDGTLILAKGAKGKEAVDALHEAGALAVEVAVDGEGNPNHQRDDGLLPKTWPRERGHTRATL